eukprot:6172025-Pleurochrysis_carterae.AAC.2
MPSSILILLSEYPSLPPPLPRRHFEHPVIARTHAKASDAATCGHLCAYAASLLLGNRAVPGLASATNERTSECVCLRVGLKLR